MIQSRELRHLVALCGLAGVVAGNANAQPAQDSAAAFVRQGRAAYDAKQFARAAEAFARSVAIVPNPVAIYNAAASYARAGNREFALGWLERTVQTGVIAAAVIAADADFASLRGEPRYSASIATARRLLEPCREDPNARRFDFWVGNWDVISAQGQRVGQSRVEIVSGGCALLEHWTNSGGSAGKSLNAFNRRIQKWQQYWVGQAGEVTEYLDSEWRDGALVYSGTGSARDGSATLARLTFKRLPDGSVQQLGESSTDGGKTWTVRYDYRYQRKQ